MGRVQAVSRLCELHPGICLTTEEKERTVGAKISSSRDYKRSLNVRPYRTFRRVVLSQKRAVNVSSYRDYFRCHILILF